jgi:hypothetical protein
MAKGGEDVKQGIQVLRLDLIIVSKIICEEDDNKEDP